MPLKAALVPIAAGTEEIEAVCIIDVLRRAGVEVTVASAAARRMVTCSRGVILTADVMLDDLDGREFDLIAVPGGMPGAEYLRHCEPLGAMLRSQHARGALVAAICAAPALVLQPLGILDGRAATCHPAFVEQLDPARRREDRVVVDGHVVTSRGPGTALEFAFTLVEELLGDDARAAVAGPMLAQE